MSDGNLEHVCAHCGDEVERAEAHVLGGRHFHLDCCPSCPPVAGGSHDPVAARQAG